jgi:hypothetical protein
MKKVFFYNLIKWPVLWAIFFVFFHFSAKADFDGLVKLEGFSLAVYVSKGHEALGKQIASLVDGANQYMSELVDKPAPEVTLLVLSTEDWGKFTNPQIIYGMPHYGGNANTLVVAAEDNFFWRANMPPLHALTPEQQEVFRQVYTNEAGELSVRPFFDVLAIHELGHGWTGNHKIKRQRFWLEEVFCNVFLHTYIAEKRPELLPALEVLPMLQVAGNRDQFKYTTLTQFEEGYWIIGREAPVNYGWYQFRFHNAAKQVYDQAGPAALKNLWNFKAGLSEVVDEDKLIYGLQNKVHPAMANVSLNWEN